MKRSGLYYLIICVLFPAMSFAESEEDAMYLYRSDVMEMSQKHLKALKRYVNGELAIKDHVPAHIDTLLALNGMYLDLFPPGKQHPESEALPAVWNDSRGFQQAHGFNRKRIMALQQVDPSDIAKMKRAVNDVRMSCGDCHYYYKQR